MYIVVLFKYILGYVHIRIEGFFVERVMNNAIAKKLFILNIKRDKTTIIYANVGVKDFKILSKIAKDNKCRIKIIKKKGMPFVFNKYKKRKIFVILIAIVILVVLTLSNFIWNIQIEGVETIDKNELIGELKINGLDTGKLKNKLDCSKIINQIRLERDDISWLGIELKGTNAIVKVVEAEAKPELINEEEYCNIIAKKDSEIIKISAINGTPVVKEGEIVTKGQTLIAGWMEGKFTGTRYVHAAGEVKAKVLYKEKTKIELKQNISEKTGNWETKYKIKFNNFEINLYKTLSKFEKYDTIYASNKLKIFSNFYLPIEVIKLKNYEIIEKEITYGAEEAIEVGKQILSDKLEKEIENKDNILQKHVNTYASDTYIEVELIYEVLENIGTKEKIVF